MRVRRLTWGRIWQYSLLVVLLLLTFFVIFVMVSMSLRPTALIYADFWGLPLPPIFQNYREALFGLIPAMLRTLAVACISVVGILAFACPAGYAFSRVRLVGKRPLFLLVLAVMMIPGAIMLTPHFILASRLGLRDSVWGLSLFYIAGGQPFAVFLLSSYFSAQSEEIFESARIDGASELRALWSIAIPLSMPILMTIAMMNFMAIYNDYIWPTLVMSTQNEMLMTALERYNPPTTRFGTWGRPDLGAQTAGFVFATVPQLVLFAFGMQYFIQGLTTGAVKA